GMQMAAADVNQAGIEVAGKKIKFEIVPLDDKYNPAETAINARRLAQEQQATVVLVPHSGGGFAVQTSNEQQKLLLLSYTPACRRSASAATNSPYVFRPRSRRI
ncbi:ABC transporter substrate-binding protein, partial [Klebsiella pneumoniae]|nr:ABC transporter substrate-binding protein [Klebsiella pneumoniae]